KPREAAVQAEPDDTRHPWPGEEADVGGAEPHLTSVTACHRGAYPRLDPRYNLLRCRAEKLQDQVCLRRVDPANLLVALPEGLAEPAEGLADCGSHVLWELEGDERAEGLVRQGRVSGSRLKPS